MMMTQPTIKQLRSALKRWGRFWRAKELGKGFSRQAVTERIGDSSARYVSSDMMSVPEEIEALTQQIAQLRPECIRALRGKYLVEGDIAQVAKTLGFDSKRSLEFWLVKAERSLLQTLCQP
ncbi:hypothetical protein CWB99_06600 [Pseudoalteromonas rubra]|uniref:RNA polymerase sigma factor 70 region 4 type 2 domain-containing protein n=1 Tax=Pseudoalteromonas rubra TaxID=43658 RepID=A0A5S3WQH8_9GAMM|nr:MULTISPECIES: hypothetical protein [Pseudoalteromonas]AZZ99116.1 hypothetical protein ELR70_19630 [Pseudoalteromonas sp. R3]TMP30406.1 hypothetical protein CWB99_06600 [Pseudoalteromonas rubra]TMP35430.1 hypothetical protein CWC00_04660 [Pseudoalteromonas rubra]